MTAITLNNIAVTSGYVDVPKCGLWQARLRLDKEASLSGPVELKVGTRLMRGTIVRGGPYAGSSDYVLVGGAGGWQKTVRPRFYRSNAGVKLSTVLGDAASEVGEKIEVGEDRSIGTAYPRPFGEASTSLRLFAKDQWWMDFDGITRLGARKPSSHPEQVDLVEFSEASKFALIVTPKPDAIDIGQTVMNRSGRKLVVEHFEYRIEEQLTVGIGFT